jgi:MIP family channel proteins
MTTHVKKYVAECLGTFALVFIGAGAVVVEGHTGASHGLADAGKLGIVGIALAHGVTLTAMIYGVGSISGGHFNPAISLAAWVRKRLTADLVIGYMVAQFLGALVAATLLAMIFPDEVGLAQLGTPMLGPRISGLQGFAIEAAITFLLSVVVLTSTRPDNNSYPFAGLAIGATLIGIILFAGPLTGASANPARYLGPAIITKNFDQIWLYILAPLYGGALGAFVIGLGVETRDATSAATAAERRVGKSTPRLGQTRRRARTEELEEIREAETKGDDDGGDALAPPSQQSVDRIQRTLKKAQELYWTGDGEKAASTLIPFLARARREGRAIGEDVRRLLMVIEDTHGRLTVLDRYRQFLERPQGAQAASPIHTDSP